MSRPRVSLVDIAKASGFSVMTVSYALRNHPKIRTETREKIQAIAEELGYVPDPEIVKLMSRIRMNRKIAATSVVAVLDLYEDRRRFTQDPYTNALVAGAEARFEKLGYQLTRFRVMEAKYTAKRIASIFRARGIEGVLLPPFPTEVAKFELDWSPVFSVCTEEKFHTPALHKVIPHHYSNMLQLLRQLWEKGYRRPGLATCKNSLDRDNYAWFGAMYSFFNDRVKGPCIPPLPIANDPKEMAEWYAQFKPDVIIVTEGWILENFIKETGLRLPRDVGGVCLAADYTELSGIQQRPEVIGSAAADMLTAHIIRSESGIPATPKTMMIEGGWIDRGTVRVLK